MAKWKNALLISTIVAPIAFGAGPVGDALADVINEKGVSTKYTDVTVHKYLNTTGDDSSKNNYYWGNGEDITESDTKSPNGAAAFTEAKGWQKAKTGYQFTAYQLPTDVISGYSTQDNEKDKPTISSGYVIPLDLVETYLTSQGITSVDEATDRATAAAAGSTFAYAALADQKWSDILKAKLVPNEVTAQNSDGGVNKSNYTFVLSTDSDVVSQLQAYLETVDTVTDNTTGDANKFVVSTNSDGDATFQDLSRNEWIIFETDNPADDESLTAAVPMVLNLSMMRADGNSWFGTATKDVTKTENEINLYPKDYLLAGSLKVVKSNINNAKLSGVDFLLLQDSDEAGGNIAKLRADIAANTEFTVSTSGGAITGITEVTAGTEGAKTIVEMGTDEVKYLLTSTDRYTTTTGEGDDAVTTKISVSGQATTGSEGVASFSVKPNQTYYIMETSVGSNEVDEIDVVQEVHTTANKEDGTDVEEDGTVYFDNGVSNITNMPIPKVDKKIAVAQNPDADKTWIYQDNDFLTGVSRGEHFKYSVSADYNNALANNVHSAYVDGDGKKVAAVKNGYDVFKISDTFDHEIDITGFQIGTTVNGTYAPLYDVVMTVNNKDQSKDGGFSSAGGTYAFKIYDAVNDSAHTKDLSGDLATSLKITGTPATYTSADGATVTTSTQGNITVELLPGTGGTDADPADLSGNTVAQKLVAALGTGDSAAKTGQMTLILDAQTNSSATVGEINNDAKLTSQPVYGSPSVPDDSSKTYNAGWEFIKTDADNVPLKGAGFDLSRVVSGSDIQGDRFLNSASGILDDDIDNASEAVLEAYVNEAKALGTGTDWYLGTTTPAEGGEPTKGSAVETAFTAALKAYNAIEAPDADDEKTLAKALLAVLNDSAQYGGQGKTVYFAHLDEDGAPVPVMTETGEMGDVLWTPYKALATTHYTDDHGYFQYCGLASGPYTLSEVDAPSGFSPIKDINFFLGDQELMTNGTGTIPATNPYPADGTDEQKEKHAAWDATYDALLAANGGESDSDKWKFKLLSGAYSDDKINGSGVTLASGEAQQIKNYEKSIFLLVGGIGTLFAVIAGLLAMGLALLKRKKDMKNEA